MFENQITQFKNFTEQFFEKYEPYLPALFFTGGFVLDIFTLGEVDDLSNIILFGLYLFLSYLILFFELFGIETIETKYLSVHKLFEYKEEAFHFFLGALLSAFTLFYFKSSSVASSFFFLLVMVSLLILNETSLLKSKGLIVRSALLMLAVASYMLLLIPIILGLANWYVFILSLLMALTITCVICWYLLRKNLSLQFILKNFLYPQLIILGLFISLYAMRILPPVPLSLKTIAVYHHVGKTTENGVDKYYALTENPRWKFWNYGDQDFKARPGDKVYIATNIFSPAGFNGKVNLKFLTKTSSGFKVSDKIPIEIAGGRKAGFRGYAYKQNYTPGEWQARVETDEGLEIGRISFTIEEDPVQSQARTFRKVDL